MSTQFGGTDSVSHTMFMLVLICLTNVYCILLSVGNNQRQYTFIIQQTIDTSPLYQQLCIVLDHVSVSPTTCAEDIFFTTKISALRSTMFFRDRLDILIIRMTGSTHFSIIKQMLSKP